MRVLLIGAYGFIGSGIVPALIAAGHEVTGLGRSARTARRTFPDMAWQIADLNHMTRPGDWTAMLHGVDAVVNASGALQSGGGDRLEAIQGASIRALIEACEAQGVARFIQISAPGAQADDASPFLSTKALADDRLRASRLHWAILRPGLVIGRNAYGGTLLLRALAAMPLRLCVVHGQSRIQSVALDDVAEAVRRCLASDVHGIDVDLVERAPSTLAELIRAHRRWLGIAPAPMIALPGWIAKPVSGIADLLGHLGWRSPLRSTAMAMIARDVRGDPAGGEALLGRPLLTLGQMLARNPAGLQDRWQARLVLLMPFILAALALLFLLSGFTSLMQVDRVAAELDGTVVAGLPARLLGVAGALADIALGSAILVRRWARGAALGMAGLTIGYLLMGSWLRPDMWSDPLAPLAKAGTALMLALVAHALLEER
ncbi:SDR family oxidoreductase [Sphingobium sp. WCS2017Hpa-17]|uniref:SDR family oxidoreductase n=1 Tax=Sphingobium sp. WCS2017Hpa-17 TaxID=3073638 RepID=UPI00288C2831|nr:SDR family oxidoreductase [Sphingobium sp. WCS2017Hpa-17]